MKTSTSAEHDLDHRADQGEAEREAECGPQAGIGERLLIVGEAGKRAAGEIVEGEVAEAVPEVGKRREAQHQSEEDAERDQEIARVRPFLRANAKSLPRHQPIMLPGGTAGNGGRRSKASGDR